MLVNRLAEWIDALFGLPATTVRVLSAAALLALLTLGALVVLPPLQWGLGAWSILVRADARRAADSEQLAELASSWIRQRVETVLRPR